jgi:hypothetical protein
MLHRLVGMFDDYVYPLFPLVHQPSIHEMLETGAYNDNPAFLRRCLALCAITVASAPNREKQVCTGHYSTYQAFVSRACDLVVMSRMATDPTWDDEPSFESAIDSTLLSMACHYADRNKRGWVFANEAILIIRDLQLHKPEGLSRLTPADSERCKRMFWVLHKMQMSVCLFPLFEIHPGTDYPLGMMRSSRRCHTYSPGFLHVTRTGKLWI